MKKEEAIKYLQQLYPYGGHCWLDEQRIEAIDMAVKALQKEPVSEELDAASIAYAEAFMKDVNRLEIQQAKWHECHPEEPVIQGGIKACFIFMRNAFMAGAEWQKKQDQETIELAEDHAMLAGMEKMKEEMMAKAIDATIEEPEPLLWRVLGELEGLFVVENNLHDGDGVKVIIVKED